MFLLVAFMLIGAALGDCPAGYKVTGGGKCEICPTGSYQPDVNGAHCWNCPWETFADARGSTTCRKCPVNHFTARTGSEKYSDCVGPKLKMLLCERDNNKKCISRTEHATAKLPTHLRLRSMEVISGVWEVTKTYPDSELIVRVEEGTKGPVPDDYQITAVNPIVNNVFCYTGKGREYQGSYSTTQYDTTCLNWSTVNGGNTGPNHNYCRGSEYGERPWCYVDGDLSPRAVKCSLPKCVWDEKCKSDEVGGGYRGDASATESGYTCQNWNSNSPHIHYYEQDYTQGIGEHNHCRNPSEDQASKPWCYTTNLLHKWDYCNINTCDAKTDPRFEYVDYPWAL